MSVSNNGDISQPCTALVDGGSEGCNVANGEFCLSFTQFPDAGFSDQGACSASCNPSSGEPCAGDSLCYIVDEFGDGYCFADCSTTGSTSTCPDALVCSAVSPNPGEAGMCLPPFCATAADCNSGSTTKFACVAGVCECTADSDCNGGAADAGPGSLSCDRLNGTCYTACGGPTDFSTCQNGPGGCCGQTSGVNFCDSTGLPNHPLCGPCGANTDCTSGVCDVQGFCNVSTSCVGSDAVCGGAFSDAGSSCDTLVAQCICPGEVAQVGLCAPCTDPVDCVSGNCDALGFCNLPANVLCSHAAGACGAVTGATCNTVTDDCTCPGEASVSDGGLCTSLTYNPFDNGDISHACVGHADGTETGCFTGELCLVTDGGAAGPGTCTAQCDAFFGPPCPAGALCNANDICVAQCNIADGGGCAAGLTCLPQSPNPADPGTCQVACAANADCTNSGTGNTPTCSHGVCVCTQDADCSGGVDGGPTTPRCDVASGACYTPCSSGKACGTVGGCCEQVGSLSYCNPGNSTGAPLTATCGTCATGTDCASGFCDATGHCNVADLCSQSSGECEYLGSTCAADNCLCGEADAGPLGGACYLVPQTLGSGGGDMGAACTMFADGGFHGCDVANSEFCIGAATAADGGFNSVGFCTLDCSNGEACPGTSQCLGIGNGESICFDSCLGESDGGSVGCPSGVICSPLTINPSDLAYCSIPQCASTADCTSSFGAGFTCHAGICFCGSNDECATADGPGYACDAKSGQCYLGCADNKMCAVGTGGCCAEYNSNLYCDPSGAAFPDGG